MNPEMQKTTDPVHRPQAVPATILLVEDETAVREVTREALEMGGYQVLEAGGPEEAAGIVNDRSREINLLLTDVVMPGMSGIELARQLSESRPALVTIFMTGYTESEILRTATRGALQNHIQKPFTVDDLLMRVGEALAPRWRRVDEYRPSPLRIP